MYSTLDIKYTYMQNLEAFKQQVKIFIGFPCSKVYCYAQQFNQQLFEVLLYENRP